MIYAPVPLEFDIIADKTYFRWRLRRIDDVRYARRESSDRNFTRIWKFKIKSSIYKDLQKEKKDCGWENLSTEIC